MNNLMDLVFFLGKNDTQDNCSFLPALFVFFIRIKNWCIFFIKLMNWFINWNKLMNRLTMMMITRKGSPPTDRLTAAMIPNNCNQDQPGMNQEPRTNVVLIMILIFIRILLSINTYSCSMLLMAEQKIRDYKVWVLLLLITKQKRGYFLIIISYYTNYNNNHNCVRRSLHCKSVGSSHIIVIAFLYTSHYTVKLSILSQ